MKDFDSISKQEWDVVVLGGGCTGAGILRDLAMRGVKALLLEQRDLVHGTSSRFHGLLHSGGRYAVGDPEAGRECIEENTILRRIGEHCVEFTEGFFVRTPEDDPAYEGRWLTACAACGITTTPVTVAEALRLEPNLSPDICAAYRVPDAGVDGFRLVWQNVLSARRHGGEFSTYTQVVGIEQANGQVTGVRVRHTLTGVTAFIPCRFIVNASGSWVGRVAQLAGLDIHVRPDRGTLLAFNHRVTDRVINRLHTSGDGDIFVPHGSITILGTTSGDTEDPEDTTPTMNEVLALLDLGRPLFPNIDQFRILRAFSGTRPLYTADNAGGRGASRNFVVLDHEKDGLSGMASICGGKLTTYRLMAERMTDLVCAKLGVNAPCTTANEPLVPPVSAELWARAAACFPAQGVALAASRLGDALESAVARMEAAPWKKTLLCECELVTVGEFEEVASEPTSHSLNDIRRRTRMGMGTCQGGFCGLRGAGVLLEPEPECPLADGNDNNDPTVHPELAFPGCRQGADLLRDFQEERWHGFRPVLWGGEVRECELARGIYAATLNIDGVNCDV